MTIRQRQLACGVILTVVPLAITGATAWLSGQRAHRVARDGALALARNDVDHVAEMAYRTCEITAATVRRRLETSLKLAHDAMPGGGVFATRPEQQISWSAKDQVSGAERAVVLPAVTINGTPVEPNDDPARSSPAVDSIRSSTGLAATVFERMNDAGDMLRVTTNVVTKGGRRAVGTFIASKDAAGAANRIVDTVLRGETFFGRAFVVNEWYFAAYEPIREGNRVIGMLFIGFPERDTVEAVLEQFKNVRIGRTGYIYVLRGTGADRGRYLLSLDRKRDGENIWEAKDAEGHKFIQTIINEAVALGPMQTGERRYPWKNAGDAAAQLKLARFRYFGPWDWVIASSVPEAELMAASDEVERVAARSNATILIVSIIAVAAAVAVWILVSNRISGAIGELVVSIRGSSSHVAAIAGQVSSAAQSLSQGASEQATEIEETSASMEQMAALTRRTAESSQAAAGVMKDIHACVQGSNAELATMVASMAEIQDSSRKVSRIIKTIDEIAFQTNILALNAAVEAARAGEAGQGFAVVADEVRTLAQRAAQASRDTAELIEKSIATAATGSSQVERVAAMFGSIGDSVAAAKTLVDQVSAGNNQQAQGIVQVSEAIGRMEKVTQAASGTAEESAAASEELAAHAETAMAVVYNLEALVGVTRTGVAVQPARAEVPVAEAITRAA